jgi:hypothetical protein
MTGLVPFLRSRLEDYPPGSLSRERLEVIIEAMQAHTRQG